MSCIPHEAPYIPGRIPEEKAYLMRKFKADTGYGLHQYIRSKRLLMARDLLKTDSPITRIATDVGFMDYSTFSRAFKSMFGCTPREYRNSQVK